MKRTEFKQQVCKKFQEVAFVNSKMINQFTVDWLIDIMAEVITDGLIRDGVFSIRDIIKITVSGGELTAEVTADYLRREHLPDRAFSSEKARYYQPAGTMP